MGKNAGMIRAAAALALLAAGSGFAGASDSISLQSQSPEGSLYLSLTEAGSLTLREELPTGAPRSARDEVRKVVGAKARGILRLARKNGFLALDEHVIGRGARPEGGDTVFMIELRSQGKRKRVQVQGEMPAAFAAVFERLMALVGP